MNTKQIFYLLLFLIGSTTMVAQVNQPAKPFYVGKVSSVEYVTPLSARPADLIPAVDSPTEIQDGRSRINRFIPSNDPQTEDDYFVRNRHEMEQSVRMASADLTFNAYSSSSQPTDPALAIGPNHVFVVYNTGFTIYDKSGNQLVGQTSPSPAIFPSGGCCDLTASYDNAAGRWVLSFLGNGAQIAVSDGPDPVNAGWYVYSIPTISDYQKLSVWSDGYYMTDNTGSNNRVWALERSQMLNGNSAQILGFNLPGIVTSGFYSPQALNVTAGPIPAAGGATVVYLQDDAWNGVSNDHIKLWTIDVDWNNTGNSSVSAAQEISATPFISVFDNGSFSNLRQPGSGRPISIDALQATIMNQAQFRKYANHNSAVFNFVVDTDASSGERAGIRWYEFRQAGDNQPWSLYQEGTYTAPDGRHAWNGSMGMDGDGNIGMGYTSMSGPDTPSTVFVSSYFTGRFATDPLGVMTAEEGLIANGDGKIPGTRYGDYSKLDVDPSDDASFWFINEYMNNGRKGVVGKFKLQAATPDTEAPSTPTNVTASNVTSSGAEINWTASSDNVGVVQYNVLLDGSPAGSTSNTSFQLSGLDPLTSYTVTVNAEDAAGNVSGNGSTNFTTLEGGGNNGAIAAYYFETGLEGWIDGGSDCARQATSNAFEGSYAVLLRDDSSSSNAVSPALDLSGNSTISIEFHTYASSMEPGEDFFVEFFNGSGYQVIGQYVSGTDFSNNSFFTDTIVLDSGTYNFNSSNRFRIRCDASANNDRIWFDQVIITGDSGLAPEVSDSGLVVRQFADQANDIRLFPNPAQTTINVEVLGGQYDQIMIFDQLGRLIDEIQNPGQQLQINISDYSNGMYFMKFVSNGLAFTKRFIKQ